jgi:hypothetical protein
MPATEALDAAFKRWREAGKVPNSLPAGLSSEELPPFVSQSAFHKLFIAVVKLRCSELEASAPLFVDALSDVSTLDTDEYALLDRAATTLPPGTSLESVLSSEDPVKAILPVLVHYCESVHVSESAAETAAAPNQPKYTLREIAYYVSNRVIARVPQSSFGTAYLIHKALFWAHAAWAYKRKTLLSECAPLRMPHGPWFREVSSSINAWRESDSPAPAVLVEDSEIQLILNVAIDHVLDVGWETACDETHREPLWLTTDPNAQMLDLVYTYSHADATGALHRIFGHELLESAAGAASGHFQVYDCKQQMELSEATGDEPTTSSLLQLDIGLEMLSDVSRSDKIHYIARQLIKLSAAEAGKLINTIRNTVPICDSEFCDVCHEYCLSSDQERTCGGLYACRKCYWHCRHCYQGNSKQHKKCEYCHKTSFAAFMSST